MKSWPWVVAIAVFAAIGIGLMVAYPTEHSDSNKADSFSADLAFIFSCTGKADPPSDNAIEQFMVGKGFRVLNKVRLAREQHVDYDWMKMDIIGIDSTHRKMDFTAFPEEPNSYFVRLNSEPPTHHSTDLEDALLGFTENTLGCTNHQIERFQNAANAKEIYDYDFKQTEGWYEQAAEMQASSKK